MSAQTTLNSAIAAGFDRLSSRDVMLCILQGASTGSGPGTGTFSGTGSPEGVVTASPGSTYLQTESGSFWMKQTGTGNTGWLEIVA